MSLVYKRNGSPYWYTVQGRQSTKTHNKKLAEEYARKLIAENWRNTVLRDRAYTFKELAEDWLDRKQDKASFNQDAMVIRRMSELLVEKHITELAGITADVVSEYGKRVRASASASTANRHLNTVRAMLNRAEAKEWISRAPTVEQYEVTEKEAHWLRPEQAAAILPHLPEWVADMYVFAQQTGMRFSNVAQLRWDWLSADYSVATIPATNTKSKKTYTIPLSDAAKAVVQKQRNKDNRHAVYVFVGVKRVGKQFTKGKRTRSPGVFVECAPVRSVRYWWEQAREAVGMPELKWHEATRHTWASHHTLARTPDRVLAKLGGWSSTRMLARYAHIPVDHLTEYVNNPGEVLFFKKRLTQCTK